MIEPVIKFITISIHHFCRDTERNKEIAFQEAHVYEYVEILGVSPLVYRRARSLRDVRPLIVGSVVTVSIVVGGYRSRGS